MQRILNKKKFTKKTLYGIQKWPNAAEETLGYIVLKNGLIHLKPYDVSLTSLPSFTSVQILGTFHSHPHGCRLLTNFSKKNKQRRCYHQPPSLKDLISFRKLSINLNLSIHMIVTVDRIFFITTFPAPDGRFKDMMAQFREHQNKNIMPKEAEPDWFSIAKDFTDVMTVDIIIL